MKRNEFGKNLRLRFTVFLLGLLIGTPAAAQTVRADVIFEPEDSFYQTHSSACIYENRCYTVHASGGTLNVYEAPDQAKVRTTLADGQKVYIMYVYQDTDGRYWGYLEQNRGEECGWIAMNEVDAVYDHVSFAGEYADKITAVDGQELSLPEEAGDAEMLFWDYPGAKEPGTLSSSFGSLPQYFQTFSDEYGHSWGYVGYYFGYRNFWVCLDAPTATFEELYDGETPVRGANLPECDTRYKESGVVGSIHPTQKAQQEDMIPILCAGVVVIIVITSLLLLRIRKKEKNQ